MTYPAPTSGVGTPAALVVDAVQVTLSMSGTGFPTTHQISTQIKDAAGNEQATGVALVLSAAAAASGGATVYTGTITGGASNALAGFTFEVAGFDLAANNGTFVCTASTTTTLTLENPNGVADTHAGTATQQESKALTYVAYGSRNFVSGVSTPVVTVSADGLVTATAPGSTVVEISYPAFNNAHGDIVNSANVMNGLPYEKIYGEVNVTVVP